MTDKRIERKGQKVLQSEIEGTFTCSDIYINSQMAPPFSFITYSINQ